MQASGLPGHQLAGLCRRLLSRPMPRDLSRCMSLAVPAADAHKLTAAIQHNRVRERPVRWEGWFLSTGAHTGQLQDVLPKICWSPAGSRDRVHANLAGADPCSGRTHCGSGRVAPCFCQWGLRARGVGFGVEGIGYGV